MIPKGLPPFGPVVIGGIGGSGTRVVAQLLLQMGFFLGNDRSRADDNPWFSLLFRRPQWFAECARGNKGLIYQGFDIHERAMSGTLRPGVEDLFFIFQAVREWSSGVPFRPSHNRLRRLLWSIARVSRMIGFRESDIKTDVGWGWKSPFSHIYLEFLSEYYGNLRYIHVIRHGLDMAFSKNKNQLFLWGPYMDIAIPQSVSLWPKAALEFWKKTNKRAIALGELIGPDQFMIINFDKFCSEPQTIIEEVVTFLQLDVASIDIEELCRIPRMPASIGRYHKYDLGQFTEDDFAAIREFGFNIDV